MNCYYNAAGQRFGLQERALEPREDAPLRYCTRCGGEIYYGADTLCSGCLAETGGEEYDGREEDERGRADRRQTAAHY